jgi:signal transduction histidine kinase
MLSDRVTIRNLARLQTFRFREGFLANPLARLILIAAAICVASLPAGAQTPQKSVMFLYSGERTVAGRSAERMLANAAIVDLAVERALRQELDGYLYHYSEHIDTMRLDDADYVRDVQNLLRSKYRGQPLDLIFVRGDVAVDFVRAQRASFFPEIPIVFATADPVAVMPNSTGIVTPIRQRRVLETALRVQPDTRHVAIVAGSSAYDQYYVRSARAEFTPYEGRLTFTYLTGLPMGELLTRVSTLPPRSIILYMGVTQDGDGRLFLPQEMLESVTAAANAPTFGWNALGMGHGLVGGTMNTPEVTARHLAALGLRVMRGERAQDIAVTEIDAAITQFDWRQLRRWNISEARLPPNSTILFREPGPWQLYRAYIIGGALLMTLQSALIAGLMVQRTRRRRTEVALRESERQSRASAAQNQELSGRLISAQEEERARIARDLHDDISQQLAGVSIMLSSLKRIVRAPSQGDVETLVSTLQDRTSGLAEAIRNLSHQLHPSLLQHTGVVAALQRLCVDLERHHAVAISFTAPNDSDSLHPDVALCLFRVAQEALANATRHARARTIEVQLAARPGGIELRISDDGVGFVTGERTHFGLGLRSIEERVRLVQGTVELESQLGKGTSLRVYVPHGRPLS